MYKFILYAISILCLVFIYVKYIESRSIFIPSRELELDPAYLNLRFEDIYFNTSDGLKINGWLIPANNPKYTLLFLHGNGGNIGHRLEKLNMLSKIGLNVFIIDYRGYGKSAGRPSEAGLYLDAKAAYDYLVNGRKINPENIILYGESIGTAATIDLAYRVLVKAIILEGAFSSGKDMARRVFALIPNFFFSDRFNSLKKIPKVKAAKLFLHSRNDEIVPLVLAKKLFDSAPEPKTFVELIGGHNTAYFDSQDKYLSAIASFVDKL
jgi:hypothetical protein